MKKRFSKELFMRHAGKEMIKIFANHLEYLDGTAVVFWHGVGEIQYSIDMVQYKMYPVYPEWCK